MGLGLVENVGIASKCGRPGKAQSVDAQDEAEVIRGGLGPKCGGTPRGNPKVWHAHGCVIPSVEAPRWECPRCGCPEARSQCEVIDRSWTLVEAGPMIVEGCLGLDAGRL